MTKWIDVNDRLPTEDYSLVLREEHGTKKKSIELEHLSECTNLSYTKPYRGEIFTKPTHWQPLPIVDV